VKDEIIEKKIQSYINFFLKIFQRLKLRIEIEKMKLDLKNKYKILGKYVVHRKEKNSMVDFSHDELYENKINEIIKLKFYINNQIKSK